LTGGRPQFEQFFKKAALTRLSAKRTESWLRAAVQGQFLFLVVRSHTHFIP
jgi:hypothetical protein